MSACAMCGKSYTAEHTPGCTCWLLNARPADGPIPPKKFYRPGESEPLSDAEVIAVYRFIGELADADALGISRDGKSIVIPMTPTGIAAAYRASVDRAAVDALLRSVPGVKP